MIYGEFIEHDRHLPVEIFERVARQDGWSGDGDRKVANLGRAERIGPEPSVMCFWRHSGMRRMDEWEASFRTNEARRDPGFLATRLSIHFVRSGLYDELFGRTTVPQGFHYVEFFKVGEDDEDVRINDRFQTRSNLYPEGSLDLVLRRVGLLAPDPGGIAVWTFAGYEQAERIVREKHGSAPYRPVAAGLYYDFENAVV